MIVLGRADPEVTVRALERCDDYLARPFVYEELVARIRARAAPLPASAASSSTSAPSSSTAPQAGAGARPRSRVSQKEYALLVKLAADPDRVFTREHLLRDVWGYPAFGRPARSSRTPPGCACKLEAAGLQGWVVNVWGVGYKLRPASPKRA